jgi:hypothetical protein
LRRLSWMVRKASASRSSASMRSTRSKTMQCWNCDRYRLRAFSLSSVPPGDVSQTHRDLTAGICPRISRQEGRYSTKRPFIPHDLLKPLVYPVKLLLPEHRILIYEHGSHPAPASLQSLPRPCSERYKSSAC